MSERFNLAIKEVQFEVIWVQILQFRYEDLLKFGPASWLFTVIVLVQLNTQNIFRVIRTVLKIVDDFYQHQNGPFTPLKILRHSFIFFRSVLVVCQADLIEHQSGALNITIPYSQTIIQAIYSFVNFRSRHTLKLVRVF